MSRRLSVELFTPAQLLKAKSPNEIRLILTELLTCQLTLDKLKQPFLLSCGHSFEEEELRLHLEGSVEFSRFPKDDCPCCRNMQVPPRIKDLKLVELLSKLDKSDEALVTYLCENFFNNNGKPWQNPRTLGCGHSFDNDDLDFTSNNNQVQCECPICHLTTPLEEIRENYRLLSIVSHNEIHKFIICHTELLDLKDKTILLLPYYVEADRVEKINDLLTIDNRYLLLHSNSNKPSLLVLALRYGSVKVLCRFIEVYSSDWLVDGFVSEVYFAEFIDLFYKYFKHNLIKLLAFLETNLVEQSYAQKLKTYVVITVLEKLVDKRRDYIDNFFTQLDEGLSQQISNMKIGAKPIFQWVLENLNAKPELLGWLFVVEELIRLDGFDPARCCQRLVKPVSLFISSNQGISVWQLLVTNKCYQLINYLIDKLRLFDYVQQQFNCAKVAELFINIFVMYDYNVDIVHSYIRFLPRKIAPDFIIDSLLKSCYVDLVTKKFQGYRIVLKLLNSSSAGVNHLVSGLHTMFRLAIARYASPKDVEEKSLWQMLICKLLVKTKMTDLHYALDILLSKGDISEVYYILCCQMLMTECRLGKLTISLDFCESLASEKCNRFFLSYYLTHVVSSKTDLANQCRLVYKLFYSLFYTSRNHRIFDAGEFIKISSLETAEALLTAADLLFRALKASSYPYRNSLLIKLQQQLVVLVERWCSGEVELEQEQLLSHFQQTQIATWYPGVFRFFNPDWITPKLNTLRLKP